MALTQELFMSLQTFFKSLVSTSSVRRGTRRHSSARCCPPTCRPSLEPLEERWVPSFARLLDYGAGYLGALVAVDLNGDGRIDLGPISSGGGPGVNALFGNGDGTFKWAQLPGIGTIYTPVLGDLNGDAIDDRVKINVDNWDYDLRVQLGNGDGTFRETQAVVLPSQLPPGTGLYASQRLTTMTLGDLNADGKLDLVATGYDEQVIDTYGATRRDQYINVLVGYGDGTFGPSSVYYVTSSDSSSNGQFLLPVRDYDGDGKADVLATGDAVRLFRSTGDGTLQTPPSLFTGAWTTTDVNADGRLDRVDLEYQQVPDYDHWAYTIRYAHVSLGNADGSFTPPMFTDLGDGTQYRGLVQQRFADLNGDGLPDLVTVEAGDAIPGWFVCVARNDGVWAPPPPSITISDVTITEGNSGTRAATFTVTLSAGATQPVTASYATANGTAAAGSDYQAASGTLTIPAGQTSGTVTVQVNGDRVGEPNETFVVNLSNPTNATIADSQGIGTIMDDEPRISISDVSKKEGKKGQTTSFTFTVRLSAAYDQAVTISFRTTDGRAKTSDQDYVARTGTLTFAPGQTMKTITIEVKGDSKRETNETFYLDLFGLSSNALFTKSRGTGTILNDD
jgi:hypothetical protein